MSYEQVYNGEWYPLYKSQYVACCDCGLVHEIKVRVTKKGTQIQYNRDNRRTAARRRHRGVKCPQSVRRQSRRK